MCHCIFLRNKLGGSISASWNRTEIAPTVNCWTEAHLPWFPCCDCKLNPQVTRWAGSMPSAPAWPLDSRWQRRRRHSMAVATFYTKGHTQKVKGKRSNLTALAPAPAIHLWDHDIRSQSAFVKVYSQDRFHMDSVKVHKSLGKPGF